MASEIENFNLMIMNQVKYVTILLFTSLIQLPAFQTKDSLKHHLTVVNGGLISSGDESPFWFQANNSQRISEASLSLWTRILIEKNLSNKQKWDWGYKLDVIGRLDNGWSGDITQGYIEAKNGLFNVFIGRKEELLGVVDSTLSISTLVNGNNALPIPKTVLRTNGWLNVPFTKGWIQFNGYFSHGWFEKDRFIQRALLHQKYLYLNIAAKWPVNVYGGIIWNTQWGGRRSDNGEKQPSTFNDYLRVITGSQGGEGATQSDQNNALGNHLGTWEIGLTTNLNKWRIIQYWQFLWEDKSGLTPFNWRDGMIGISLKRKEKDHWFTGANLEIVRTNNQDAEKTGPNGLRFIEPDNFFNNSDFRSGWTYKGRVIGSPLFLFPDPNNLSLTRINGLINAVNLGMEGRLLKHGISYQMSYIYFKNQGNIYQRFDKPKEINSLFIKLRKKLTQKSNLLLNLIYEDNDSATSNFGVMVSYVNSIF